MTRKFLERDKKNIIKTRNRSTYLQVVQYVLWNRQNINWKLDKTKHNVFWEKTRFMQEAIFSIMHCPSPGCFICKGMMPDCKTGHFCNMKISRIWGIHNLYAWRFRKFMDWGLPGLSNGGFRFTCRKWFVNISCLRTFLFYIQYDNTNDTDQILGGVNKILIDSNI